jgi:5'-methylthioadenosine phosphorylase
MTQYPEAYLARELGLCYATTALVTDYDAGVEGDPGIEPVTMDEVLRVFDANLERLRSVLFRALPSIPAVPAAGACACADGLAADKLAH